MYKKCLTTHTKCTVTNTDILPWNVLLIYANTMKNGPCIPLYVPLILKKGIITRHNNKYKNFLADVSEHNKKQ